jgi:hypothetical protein
VPFSEGDLVELLTQSRENNTLAGITGLLLYKEGKFLQVLEGDDLLVRKLISKIEKDPRHAEVEVLRWEILKERRFPAWSMGFQNLDNVDIQRTPGYSEFMNEPLTSPDFKADPSRVWKLLRVFRELP